MEEQRSIRDVETFALFVEKIEDVISAAEENVSNKMIVDRVGGDFVRKDLETDFKTLNSITLLKYVAKRRIMAACKYIGETKKNYMDEALRLTGFADQPTFNHKFKESFGVSPTEVAKKGWEDLYEEPLHISLLYSSMEIKTDNRNLETEERDDKKAAAEAAERAEDNKRFSGLSDYYGFSETEEYLAKTLLEQCRVSRITVFEFVYRFYRRYCVKDGICVITKEEAKKLLEEKKNLFFVWVKYRLQTIRDAERMAEAAGKKGIDLTGEIIEDEEYRTAQMEEEKELERVRYEKERSELIKQKKKLEDYYNYFKPSVSYDDYYSYLGKFYKQNPNTKSLTGYNDFYELYSNFDKYALRSESLETFQEKLRIFKKSGERHFNHFYGLLGMYGYSDGSEDYLTYWKTRMKHLEKVESRLKKVRLVNKKASFEAMANLSGLEDLNLVKKDELAFLKDEDVSTYVFSQAVELYFKTGKQIPLKAICEALTAPCDNLELLSEIYDLSKEGITDTKNGFIESWKEYYAEIENYLYMKNEENFEEFYYEEENERFEFEDLEEYLNDSPER